jgi:hypothetical protein
MEEHEVKNEGIHEGRARKLAAARITASAQL